MISELFKKVLDFIPDAKRREEAKILMEEGLPTALANEVKTRLADIAKGGINSFWRPYAAVIIFTALGIRWILYPLMYMIITMFNLNIYPPEPYDMPAGFYQLALVFASVYGYVRSKYDKK